MCVGCLGLIEAHSRPWLAWLPPCPGASWLIVVGSALLLACLPFSLLALLGMPKATKAASPCGALF